MSKFILNRKNSILFIQDNERKTLCKLMPYECSFKSFDEKLLDETEHVNKLINKGIISLHDKRVVAESKAKVNHGQKYGIGTKAFIKGPNNLEITIQDYNPLKMLYTAMIDKTKGIVNLVESEITTEFTISKRNDMGELITDNKKAEVVRTENNEEKSYNTDAENMIRNIETISKNNKVKAEVILNDEVDNRKEDDSETFIVKEVGQKFAKEITNKEAEEQIVEKVKENVEKAVEAIAKNEVIEAKEEKIDLTNIPVEYREQFLNISKMDNRNQKLSINRLRNMEIIDLLIKYGSDTIKEIAKSRKEIIS